jgi:hypothetical protein
VVAESAVQLAGSDPATRRSGGSRASASKVAGNLDELVALTDWKKLVKIANET